MKCIECGHELKDGAIFCIRCGAMQVSMDGKPIERETEWPDVEAQAGASGFKSSTDGALHSAQSKNPRGFQPAPKRNGGRIAAGIVAALVVVGVGVFAATQLMAPQTSGGDASSAEVVTTSSESASTSASSTSASASSTSSTSASASSASASAASASASAASASAASAGAATQAPAQQETAPAAVEPQPVEQPAPNYNDYYVLPDSSYYYYSYGELSGMSTWDLYIARNEIYARHGRMFNRSDLQDYFNSQAWYEPIYTPAQFDSMGNMLTDAEMKNTIVMKQVEADKGSPYL